MDVSAPAPAPVVPISNPNQNFSWDFKTPAPVTGPPSTLHERRDHAQFIQDLVKKLERAIEIREVHIKMLGEEVVNKYRIGHVPQEVWAERERKLQEWIDMVNQTDDDDNDDDDDDDDDDEDDDEDDGKWSPWDTVDPTPSGQRDQQAHMTPTPSPLSDIRAPKPPASRRRGRDPSADDEEEQERPAKICNTTAAITAATTLEPSQRAVAGAGPRRSARLAARPEPRRSARLAAHSALAPPGKAVRSAARPNRKKPARAPTRSLVGARR